MGKQKSFADLLEEDFNKLQNNIAKYTVQKIADDLAEETKIAIEKFYRHYDPEDLTLHNGRIYYYRHWNFRKSFKRYYKNRKPLYIGGVELLPEELPNVYTGRSSSPMEVFGRVYYLGWHGIASGQGKVPIMNPSPMKIIMTKYDEIKNNSDEYFRYAIGKALNDSYNVIG